MIYTAPYTAVYSDLTNLVNRTVSLPMKTTEVANLAHACIKCPIATFWYICMLVALSVIMTDVTARLNLERVPPAIVLEAFLQVMQ